MSQHERKDTNLKLASYKGEVSRDPHGNISNIRGEFTDKQIADVERQKVIERTEDNCWFGNDLYG